MPAIIFDMDGVMVDSEHQWHLAEGPLFRELELAWTEEDHAKVVGLGVEDLYDFLVAGYGLKCKRERFLALCEDLAQEVYGKRVSAAAGLQALLDQLRTEKIPLALASSSPRAWIDIVLNRFELKKYFPVVVSADDVGGKGKPLPHIHLLAARRLRAAAAGCLAIEDSAHGVAAAKAAGMRCIGYRNGFNDEQPLQGVEFEIRAFQELTLTRLKEALIAS